MQRIGIALSNCILHSCFSGRRVRDCVTTKQRILVQDVMLMLLRRIPEFEYDSTLRFRSWLKTVLLNRWRDVLKQESRASVVSTIDIESVADDQDDPFWEREYRQQLVRRALEVMRTDFREATWKACWLCVVEGQTAAEAAELLGLSENAVYIAQHRVLRRLRAELDGLWK